MDEQGISLQALEAIHALLNATPKADRLVMLTLLMIHTTLIVRQLEGDDYLFGWLNGALADLGQPVTTTH